jgi:hypothetical protein
MNEVWYILRAQEVIPVLEALSLLDQYVLDWWLDCSFATWQADPSKSLLLFERRVDWE